MSNGIVGTTYEQVIEKVIAASANDFEEFGVDQATLLELKDGWQKKLTSLHVGNFPWEPQPPTLPSNVPKSEPSPVSASTPTNPANGNYGGARIKTEGGDYQSGYQQMNGFSSGLDRNVAQHRAAGLLQQRFGAQAEPVISNLTQGAGISLPGQGRTGGNAPNTLPTPGQGQQQLQGDQAKQQPPGGYGGQTDGPGDEPENWAAVLDSKAVQGDHGPTGRVVADARFREQILNSSNQMESGLMVPLQETSSARKGKKIAGSRSNPKGDQASSVNGSRIPQLDGEFSDDEDSKPKPDPDDEAINSDLDDSEDELAQADDDDGDIGDIMLCTYDKVQRVKNKWKCTLKDGILTTNGKDYLFHKANGEFEW